MPWNLLYKSQWRRIVSVVRKILWIKILGSDELNKIDLCLYQIVLFVVIKNQGSLNLRNKYVIEQIGNPNFIK